MNVGYVENWLRKVKMPSSPVMDHLRPLDAKASRNLG